MIKIIFFLLIAASTFAQESLREKISNIIVVGFQGVDPNKTTLDIKSIKKYSVAGVILFSHNIKSKKQLKELISFIRSVNGDTILIGMDEEGGKVDRLAKISGLKIPSARDVGRMENKKIKKIYQDLAKEMKNLGFNLNFAPVVDLAINDKNRVIYGAGRSYSDDPKRVAEISSIFIDAFKKEGIICCIKHFPGHGSSFADSHEGFTDVSDTWSEKELLPFLKLIQMKKADMIMSAHIYNKNLDPLYPATLSKKILTSLLKRTMKFDSVVISDDMQMGAIEKNYTLQESIKLALNGGVDLLLFSNQTSKRLSLEEIIDTVEFLVKDGSIEVSRIEDAYTKITALKRKLRSLL